MNSDRAKNVFIGLGGVGAVVAVIVTAPARTVLPLVQLHPSWQRPHFEAVSEPYRDATLLKPVRRFELTDASVSPLMVAATTTAPGCRVAIADAGKREVFVYGAMGEFVGSFKGGGREPSLIGTLSAIAILHNGDIAVGDASANRVIVISSESLTVKKIIDLQEETGMRGPVALAPTEMDQLVSVSEPLSMDFIVARPPMNLVDVSSSIVSTIGLVPGAYPTGAFSAIYTGGLVATSGPNLVHVIPETGDVAIYNLSRPRTPVDRFSLRPTFAPNRLVYALDEARDQSTRIRLISRSSQLSGVAIDDAGNLLVIQERSPTLQLVEGTGEAENFLAIVPTDRKLPAQYFRVGARIRSIAAAWDSIYAVVEREETLPDARPVRDVLVLPNPFLSGHHSNGKHRCLEPGT